MVAKNSTAKSGEDKAASPAGIIVTGDGRLAQDDTAAVDTSKNNDGGAGPPSALKGGQGSKEEVEANATRKLQYSVQIHTDEKGLEVFEPIDADSGDEAARQALAKKNYVGASVRGVQPYSDPDANSLGGERDAAIMITKAYNDGHLVNVLGTDANAEATKELGKADVKELGA